MLLLGGEWPYYSALTCYVILSLVDNLQVTNEDNEKVFEVKANMRQTVQELRAAVSDRNSWTKKVSTKNLHLCLETNKTLGF